MIDLQDVTVCYDKHRRNSVPSLDKISLQIEKGELVFLVGPSGAGKSSLLKLLYAGLQADEGRVEVDGLDISHLGTRDIPALRRKIGVVFQDFQLLNEKTAWENVAFALRVIGVPQQVIVKEVPRALETVGIAHRSHAFPHELSGGEQQRVAIARAIVNDPHLLLADEPTGNLDPETAGQIGDLLAKINRDRGTTVVLVTHDRELVDSMARRVVRLKDGRVVADDFPGRYHADDEALVRSETPSPSPVPFRVPAPAAQPRPVTAPSSGATAAVTPAVIAPSTAATSSSGRPTAGAPEISLPVPQQAAPRQSAVPQSGPPQSAVAGYGRDTAGADPRPAPAVEKAETETPMTSQPSAAAFMRSEPPATPTPLTAREYRQAEEEAAGLEAAGPWGAIPESEAPHQAPAASADSPVPQAMDNVAPLGSPENPIVLFDR